MKRSTKIGWFIAALLTLILIARLIELTPAPRRTEESSKGISFNIGKTESRNSISSSTTSSSSDNSTFSAQRILLINANPHPLSRRIGNLVAQRLRDLPQVSEVVIENSSPLQLTNAQAPDLFAQVDLVSLRNEGLVSHTLKATVFASLANGPYHGHVYNRDATTPPLVDFGWNATLDNETTFTGMRSDRYAEPARSIAEEFFKGMSNVIVNFSTEFPPMPELPREFYGPYQPVEDFKFLADLKAQRVCSYYGLLTHNETFWKFQTDTNPLPALQRMLDELQAAQWKTYDTSLANAADYSVNYSRNGASIEIYRHRRGMNLEIPPKTETTFSFIVHYRQPFTRDEREAVLEKLFTEHAALETLLPFENSFSSSQRQRFYELVEKTPADSARVYLRLTDIYLGRKQTNSALNVLLRAKALAGIDPNASKLETKINSLADQISPKRRLELEISPELCRELHFLEITNYSEPLEIERNFGKPLVLFGTTEHGVKISCLNLELVGKHSLSWIFREAEKGSRSSTSTSGDFPPGQKWEKTVSTGGQRTSVTATLLPDGKHVKYTLQREH